MYILDTDHTGMTVLTRNLVDFEKVPNLNAEDWTQ
jgi:hypothetical protein